MFAFTLECDIPYHLFAISTDTLIIVFPGGHLPTLTLLTTSLQCGSSSRLQIESISNIGPHYARTLREWRKKFEENWKEVILPALRGEYGESVGNGEIFWRKWIYYL